MNTTLKEITSENGLALKKSEINLLAKLADKWNVTLATAGDTRTNPYSGATKTLSPLGVTLFDFIIDNYRNGLVKGSSAASMSNPKAIPTATWDSARYLFLRLFPDAYYALID